MSDVLDTLTEPHRRVVEAGGPQWIVAMCLDRDSWWWEAREPGRPPVLAATVDLLCERVARRMASRSGRHSDIKGHRA